MCHLPSNLEMPDPAAKPLVQIHVRTWVDEESLDEFLQGKLWASKMQMLLGQNIDEWWMSH